MPRNISKICFILIAFGILFHHKASAIPEFSSLTGNKCASCHVNAQGGGLRNEFGWNFGKDAAMFRPDDIGLDGFYSLFDKSKYSYLNGLLAFGGNFRMMTARSHKSEDAVRKYFPMQASLYGAVEPAKWILAEGVYNFGPKIFPGQQSWSASVYLKPIDWLPKLRLGYFQPSIGERECDMTTLDRRIAGTGATETLIAPDYAEWGAEFIYDTLQWLTAAAGIYDSKSLGELGLYGGQIPLLRMEGNPSFLVKFVVSPHWLDEDLPTSHFGASCYVNADFWLAHIFGSVSVFEDLFIFGKFAMSKKEYERETRNFAIGAVFYPYNGIFLGARAEQGETKLILMPGISPTLKAWQLILNAKIIPIPYIEVIPEYRVLDVDEYQSGRWTLQVNLFY